MVWDARHRRSLKEIGSTCQLAGDPMFETRDLSVIKLALEVLLGLVLLVVLDTLLSAILGRRDHWHGVDNRRCFGGSYPF